MLLRARENDCVDFKGTTIVLLNEKIVPHSFWRYIFINREDYYKGLIPKEIIAHECAHVRQRHTFDILFIELLIAFGWFNPAFYLYRNKMKQNHEFLADDAVVGSNHTIIPVYQSFLINYLPSNKNIIFTSHFNFLIIKKRLIMLTKRTSKKRIWCSIVALIPVIIAAIFVFSTKIVAQGDTNTLPEQTDRSAGSMVQNNDRMIFPKKGASQEQMAEFQKILSKYFDINRGKKWSTYNLSKEDQARLYVIYVQMDTIQRKEQWIWFDSPLTTERERTIFTEPTYTQSPSPA
jgi:hypothetical protein